MERRDFWLALLCFVMFAELSSWMTAGPHSSLCLMKPEHSAQASNDNEQENCPTFFAGSLLLGQRGFEWIKREDNDKAVVAGFTIILAISTIGLWFATVRLWQSADETAKAQERDTRILQRAYVSVEPLGLDLLIDGAHINGKLSFKNAGNLPARNLSWYIALIATPNREHESFPLQETRGNIVISPNSETTRSSDGNLKVQGLIEMAQAGSGRANEIAVYIYVFGIIRYHDGFVDCRTTKFCHRYNWKIRPQEVGRYGMSKDLARQHAYGNESD